MKISLSPIQYFDLAGVPLAAGRIKVFLHGSDTLAPVFVMDGENFIAGQNPLVLDGAGEQHNTLFMEAAIYDIWVEKNVEGTYVKISDFQFGFNPDAVKNDTIVTGMAGLAEANPALGTVTVVGYASGNDCGPRTYIWDPSCTDDEDGCCIVRGSTEDGRWLLLSDSRYLPSNWYGIVPGVNEANLSAFLTYPERAGQWGIVFPPVPRFLTGTYTTPGTVSVTKTIAFDPGAKFTNIRFVCTAAEISGNTGYVADFQFVRQSYAESSWFRTVRGFWQCGAAELHQSRTNFFESVDMGASGLGIAHQKISGTPFAMTGTGYLLITDCDIAPKSLSTSWFTIFQDMTISDRWFADANWDIGYYAQGHHTQANTAAGCVYSPDNFDNINVMVLALAYQGVTTLDLGGKAMGTISATMPFTVVRNGIVAEAHFDNTTILENVQVGSLYLEHNYLNLTTKRCSLGLIACQCGVWNDDGSTIALGCDIDTSYTTVNWINSSVNMSGHRIGSSVDGFYTQKQVVMWRCAVTGGTIANVAPVFLDCNIADTLVYVHPVSWYDGAEMSWKFSMEFRGNRFNGASGIRIGAHTGITDHIAEVYECKVEGLSICNNVFNTSVPGITCPFWSGPNMKNRFIAGMTTYAGVDPTERNADYYPVRYEYKDNYGNCPRAYAGPTNPDLPGALAIASQWGTAGAIGNGMYFEKGQTPYSVFVLPAVSNPDRSELPDPTVSSNVYLVSTLSVCTPYRAKALFTSNQQGGGCADFPTSGYLPVCAYDKSFPNDMFNCLVGSWGESAQFFGLNPIEPGV